MAHYIVKAKPYWERLIDLRAWLNRGDIARMRPFGKTLQDSLENARIDPGGYAIWGEEDYCHPPLAQERAAVLDRHFTALTVQEVRPGEGWKTLERLPRLWEINQ
jgi:hypothetical protein